MAAIRSVDTKPELALRRLAHALGYRFRLYRRDLPGRPDLVFPGRRKVIFVHGCFWHQHAGGRCGAGSLPKVRRGYWKPKLARNVARDERNLVELRQAGWDALVVWECELGKASDVERKVRAFLGPPGKDYA
jgi:DNA mismatch endonuclease, patch repair protein